MHQQPPENDQLDPQFQRINSDDGTGIQGQEPHLPIKREQKSSYIPAVFYSKYSWVGISLQCILALIAIIILISKKQLNLASVSSRRQYFIFSDKLQQRDDAFKLAKEQVLDQLKDKDGYLPPRIDQQTPWITVAMYESKSGNVFTKENIKKIQEFENFVLQSNNKEYEKFCITLPGGKSCYKNGILKIFDKFQKTEDPFIQAVLTQLAQPAALQSGSYLFFDQGFNAKNLKSKYSRAFFTFGLPLIIDGVRYKDKADRKSQQNEKMLNFMKRIQDQSSKFQNSDLTIYVWSDILVGDYMSQTGFTDIFFGLGSILLTLILLIIATRSIVIPLLFFYQMIITLVVALFILKNIFQIQTLTGINIILTFIIFGFQINHMLIYYKSWKEALNYEQLKKNQQLRIKWVFQKAGRSVFTSSLIQLICYAILGINDVVLLQINAFYCEAIVLSNLILFFLSFPGFLIIIEKYCTKNSVSNEKELNEEQNKEIHQFNSSPDSQTAQLYAQKRINQKSIEEQNQLNENQPKDFDQKHSFNEYDQHKDFGYPVLSAQTGVYSTQIDNNKPNISNDNQNKLQDDLNQLNSPDLLKGTTNQFQESPVEIQKECEKAYNKNRIDGFFAKFWCKLTFYLRYVLILLFVAWLVGCIFQSRDLKPITYEELFTTDENKIVKGHKLMFNNKKYISGPGSNVISINLLWGIKGIDRSKLDDYDINGLGDIEYDKEFDISTPEAQKYILKICSILKDSPLVLNQLVTKCWIVDFMTYVIKEGQTFPLQQKLFPLYFAKFITNDGQKHLSDFQIGVIKNSIKFMRIQAIAKAPEIYYEPHKMEKLYKEWENLMQQINKNAPKGLKNGYQISGSSWPYFYTLITQLRQIKTMIFYTILVFFFVFIVFLGNALIAFYNTVALTGIVFSVLGVLSVTDNEFGLVQCTVIIAIFAFSAEFVTYFGLRYMKSKKETQYQRVQEALFSSGQIIIFGFLINFGAGVWFFTAEFLFLSQLAYIICLTSGFSLIWCLLFLPAVYHVFGPKKDIGNVYICSNKKQ